MVKSISERGMVLKGTVFYGDLMKDLHIVFCVSHASVWGGGGILKKINVPIRLFRDYT